MAGTIRIVRAALLFVLAFGVACVPEPAPPPDAGSADAGSPDAGSPDAGERDAGEPDAGEPDAGEPDAGEPDAGPSDAGPSDAGPSICPTDPTPECGRANDCLADVSAPSNCENCVDFNYALCINASCNEPALLGPNDVYTVVVTVDTNVGNLVSFSTFAVAADTAGTVEVTCADVYAGTIDLTNRCFNVMDSRAFTVPQTGDTYGVSFSGFASGQRTLFVIYGHDRSQARGNQLGVSCTSFDVPAPSGTGPYMVSGDNMRRL